MCHMNLTRFLITASPTSSEESLLADDADDEEEDEDEEDALDAASSSSSSLSDRSSVSLKMEIVIKIHI